MSHTDTERQQLIVFRLEDKHFGVNIGQVREIMRVGQISSVPGAPDYVKGVTNLRGNVATVIDLRKRLGMPTKELGKETRMMVIESKGSSKGMIVDAVEEVTMIPKSDIEETPDAIRSANVNSAYVRGIGKKDSRLIILIDMELLVNDQNPSEQVQPVLEMAANLETIASVKAQRAVM